MTKKHLNWDVSVDCIPPSGRRQNGGDYLADGILLWHDEQFGGPSRYTAAGCILEIKSVRKSLLFLLIDFTWRICITEIIQSKCKFLSFKVCNRRCVPVGLLPVNLMLYTRPAVTFQVFERTARTALTRTNQTVAARPVVIPFAAATLTRSLQRDDIYILGFVWNLSAAFELLYVWLMR